MAVGSWQLGDGRWEMGVGRWELGDGFCAFCAFLRLNRLLSAFRFSLQLARYIAVHERKVYRHSLP